jgi:hypothetical protein
VDALSFAYRIEVREAASRTDVDADEQLGRTSRTLCRGPASAAPPPVKN